MTRPRHRLARPLPSPTALALLALFGVLGSLAPGPARAQADPDCDVADLAEEGNEALADGELDEAIQLLSEARACEDLPILRFDLARAYHEAGRCVAAHDLYVAYLESGDAERRSQALRREAESAECAARFEAALERSDAARAEGSVEEALAAIEDALAASPEPDIAIVRGELLVELGRCEEAEESLRAIDANGLSRTQRAVLDAALDGAASCEPPADPVECHADCESERAAVAAAHEDAVSTQRLVGIVTTSVGAATLVAAVVHDLASQGTLDDYEAALDAGDTARADALRSDIDDRRTISTALYGSALVVGVVGAVVWIWSARRSPAEDIDCDALCWEGGVGGPGELGAWAGFRF